MGTAIKHPVPDRVKPSFVIFDLCGRYGVNYCLNCTDFRQILIFDLVDLFSECVLICSSQFCVMSQIGCNVITMIRVECVIF